jgi:hypothetical protein
MFVLDWSECIVAFVDAWTRFFDIIFSIDSMHGFPHLSTFFFFCFSFDRNMVSRALGAVKLCRNYHLVLFALAGIEFIVAFVDAWTRFFDIIFSIDSMHGFPHLRPIVLPSSLGISIQSVPHAS